MKAQDDNERVHTFRQRALELIEKYHIKTLPAMKEGEMWVWNGKYYDRYGQQKIRKEILTGGNSIFLPNDAEAILKYVANESLTDFLQPPKFCINLENGILKYDESNEITFIKREDIAAPWDYNFTKILPVTYDPSAACPEIDTILQQILVEKSITEETKIKEDYDEWAERWKEYEAEQTAYADYMAEKYRQHEANMMPIPGEQDWKVVEKVKTTEEDKIDEKMCKIYIFEEFLGSCLMTDYEIKKALLFVGRNDTGKTTIVNIAKQFLGEKNLAHLTLQKFDAIQSPFSIKNLRDKLANIADENPNVNLKSFEVFKNATGGAPLEAQIKYSDDVNFTNTAKMLFTANTLQSLPTNVRSEVLNRLIIVEFLNEFISNDKTTNRKLKDKRYSQTELSGLLNHAIAGLKRLLQHGHFSYEEDDTSTLWDKWQIQPDPLELFFKDGVEATKNKSDSMKKSLLYDVWKKFASENNLPHMTENAFSRAVSQIPGVTSGNPYDAELSKQNGKFTTVRKWFGIRLRVKISDPNEAFWQQASNQ